MYVCILYIYIYMFDICIYMPISFTHMWIYAKDRRLEAFPVAPSLLELGCLLPSHEDCIF